MNHMHVGAQAAQDARHAVIRRTVRTIEHDLQAVELHACRALHEVDVFTHILLAALDAADVLARRTRQLLARLDAAHEVLDLVLHSIGQLVAVAAEEFDAVVIEGIMRRRDDDARSRLVRPRQIGNGGRRADADDLNAPAS